MRYDGNESTRTADQVVQYLTENYDVIKQDAEQVVLTYTEEVQDSILYGSFVSYTGDKIADEEGLEELEDEDADRD